MTLEVGVTDDLGVCLALRETVFIKEQSVSVNVERDGKDGEAVHILARVDSEAVGCARILIDGQTGKIGRVCVLQEHRCAGVGTALIQASLDYLKACSDITRAELGAQIHALGLYEKLGFKGFGPEFSDAGGVPHLRMELDL